MSHFSFFFLSFHLTIWRFRIVLRSTSKRAGKRVPYACGIIWVYVSAIACNWRIISHVGGAIAYYNLLVLSIVLHVFDARSHNKSEPYAYFRFVFEHLVFNEPSMFLFVGFRRFVFENKFVEWTLSDINQSRVIFLITCNGKTFQQISCLWKKIILKYLERISKNCVNEFVLYILNKNYYDQCEQNATLPKLNKYSQRIAYLVWLQC